MSYVMTVIACELLDIAPGDGSAGDLQGSL
ncbi:hypothetical protein FHR38_002888 [Micromonospora polyrhachis]|uniref:Uncharacterized protein n=1 Tax=Micromonospora polyrhachis TaxID=1282883 RepID=A0A7W7SQM4_9ACTN|nr:hypothetical protein [Micromonospora polyrhachis]